jgi:hypothetical protein
MTAVYSSGRMSFSDILQELPKLYEESVTAHLNRADVQGVRIRCRRVAFRERNSRGAHD